MPPAATLTATEALLDAPLLERLRRLAAWLLRRAQRGEFRGGGGGATPEFETYRPYTAGDDPRYLDWSVYARSEKLLVKLYAPESLGPVFVLLDTSASMRTGRGEKARSGARCAAAFAFLSLCVRRPVYLGAFAETLLAAAGPYRGPESLPECLRFFSRAPTGQGTRLGAAAADFLARTRNRGRLVVISDFFQDEPLPPQLGALRERAGLLHLARILDERDLEPKLRGTCLVEDPESERRIRLVAGSELQEQLRALVRGHVDDTARACRELGVSHGVIRTAERFDDALVRHLLELAR